MDVLLLILKSLFLAESRGIRAGSVITEETTTAEMEG